MQVNIEIMRAFVRIRQWLASNVELARKLADLERNKIGNTKCIRKRPCGTNGAGDRDRTGDPAVPAGQAFSPVPPYGRDWEA